MNIIETLEGVTKRDRRYKLEAYNFVLEALNYTVGRMKLRRHVSGKELLGGIKQYAKERFGPMARTVFEYWGVKSTLDFGNIVFNLVRVGVLGKTPDDSIADFQDGYDFKEVF